MVLDLNILIDKEYNTNNDADKLCLLALLPSWILYILIKRKWNSSKSYKYCVKYNNLYYFMSWFDELRINLPKHFNIFLFLTHKLILTDIFFTILEINNLLFNDCYNIWENLMKTKHKNWSLIYLLPHYSSILAPLLHSLLSVIKVQHQQHPHFPPTS